MGTDVESTKGEAHVMATAKKGEAEKGGAKGDGS
jgi:hypothetical protein